LRDNNSANSPQGCDAALVELLVAAGADVNGKDHRGGTPLHILTVRGYGCKALAVAQILIEVGTDVNVKNEYGETPLASAQEYNCDNLFKFLRKNGARLGKL
jgi:ankyrin repeat protein